MSSAYEQLKSRLDDVQNINATIAMLDWDQQTYMPKGGAASRGAQLATLSRIAHEQFTAAETGKLIDQAEAELGSADYDSDPASLVRIARRDYERKTRLPPSLVAQTSETVALANSAWVKARAENDYKAFAPWLEKMIALKIQAAECYGYQGHIYDPLLNNYEYGTTTAEVGAIFDSLKKEIVPLLVRVVEQKDRASDAVLRRFYDETKQSDFAARIARAFGYDFQRGRQDIAVHPFCEQLSRDDVRITTRFDPHFLQVALFGILHETGHALYEQNVGADLPFYLASGTSLGVHESQSRLWENVVGRSRGFWQHYYPQLQDAFPESLSDVDMETFYRAVNTAQPSFIRVEADEVTYTLHVMLRFEMEQELVSGKLSVADAPEAWNAKMQSYLGITPPTDTLGILQDIHWSIGLVGYFPTYALGTMLASQLYAKAIHDVPTIPTDIEHGKFEALLGWLRTNIHVHGRKFTSAELVKRVTGEPLNSRAYIQYLTRKYADIYGF